MPRIRWKSLALFAPFLVLNLVAWLWIRHELLTAHLDTVQVLAALPRGDADGADRLALVFDRPVGGTADAPEPQPAALFTLDPAPAGRWRWASPARLEYVLADPLPPGRVFHVRATARFETLTGRTLQGMSEFLFRTRALALGNAWLEVVDTDHLDLGLTFNQPVLPVDLSRHLTVRDPAASRDLETGFMSRRASRTVSVRVPRPAGDRVLVRLDAGLAGAGGVRTLGRRVVRALDVPRAFGLLGVRFEGFSGRGPDPDLGTAALRFTAGLDRGFELPAVRVDPPVEGMRVRWGGRSPTVLVDGRFRCGLRYTITVPEGLTAKDGRRLEADQTGALEIPDRDASLILPLDRGVLSPGGNLTLPLRTVNVARISLRGWRVHSNNLVPHLQGLRRSAAARNLGRREYEVGGERNRTARIGLDLGRILPRPLGLYLVDVSSVGDRWTRDRAVVAITDLALTAKRSRAGVTVWVTSLGGGRPVAGARVRALSRNNQVLARGTTDPDGVVDLPVPPNHPDGRAWVVTAERSGDTSYLQLDRRPRVADDVDQGGREIPVTYDLFLYPDRGVYRPGETIRLTGILRGADGSVPEPFPVAIRMLRPDGRVVGERTATPGPEGFLHVEFPTSDDTRTGPWRFLAGLPGAKETIGRAEALVEAFVPVRLELTARTDRDRYGPGETPHAAVRARYLFGRPAAGLSLRVRWRYRPLAFRWKALPGTVFPVPPKPGIGEGVIDGGRLDDGGAALVEIPRLPEGTVGRYALELAATVTETGSRSVSKRLSALVDTAPRHVGVRLPRGGAVPPGAPAGFSFVQRAPRGGPSPRPVPVAFRLLRVEVDWLLEEVNGRLTWKSRERTTEVERRRADAAASGRVELTCPERGRYRLLAKDTETGVETKVEFWSWSAGGAARPASPEAPDRLELVLDRESYRPGAVARALVRSPFPGTLLLTLETDRVAVRRVVEMRGTEEEIPLPLPGDLRGGAFVAATVVRAVDPESRDWKPHRAFGLARLDTDPGPHRIEMAVDAPPKARPGGEAKVSVETGISGAAVHLWAVDEGILLATGFETPDPLGHFLARRRAGVRTVDLFPDLLPDVLRPAGMLRIGGDAAAARRLRRNPVRTRRRRPAVVFRKVVTADAAGRVEMNLTLPDLEGALRIMAVAAKGDRYGSASRRLTLATPLMVEAGWPRFLAPGDQARVPVKVTNLTGDDRTVMLAMEQTGPIRIEVPGGRVALSVPAGGTATAWIEVKATGIGPAEAEVRAVSDAPGRETSRDGALFPVRPAGPLTAKTRFSSLDAGQSLEIPADPRFLAGARRRVRIAPDPEVEVRPALERLLAYPYGCVEQTTSRLLAILQAPRLLPGDGEGSGRAAIAGGMIDGGLRRLAAMETESGGLAYWPGGTVPSPWGTAYAATCLVEAQNAGYRIPESLRDGVPRYLARRLRGPSEPNERALCCRVLTAFDRPPMGWMERLSEETDRLDMAGRAHLAAAFLRAGRPDRARAVLGEDTPGIVVPITHEGRITSPARQEAVLLSVLLDLDPDHPWIPRIARSLLERRRDGVWRSTLEDASAMAALARLSVVRRERGTEPADFEVAVRCGGRTWSGSSRAMLDLSLPEGDRPVTITCMGRGTAHVALTTEGILLGGGAAVKESDQGLMVRRRWLDGHGRKVVPGRLKVGDLVRVEVTLRAPGRDFRHRIGNVAVVDALPGGFEVENPRLATSAVGDRGPDRPLCRPDRVEFLDDRVVLFTPASDRVRTFSYHLRVTGRGSFTVPPVQASAMYAPEYASVNGGGRVEVAR